MTENSLVYIFGHSFPTRFLREVHARQSSVNDVLGVTGSYNVVVDGHPGLTYGRIFRSPDHYFGKMAVCAKIDLLLVDMGTNDISARDSPPHVVVDNTLKFLDMLAERGIRPGCTVFLSVIQRSCLNRRNQVPVRTFNHRVRRFNSLLDRAFGQRPGICLYSQSRLNHPRYLADGCHLNAEGMNKYISQIRSILFRFCP